MTIGSVRRAAYSRRKKNAQKISFADMFGNWRKKRAKRKTDASVEGVTASTEESVKYVPKEKTAKNFKRESNVELEKTPSKFNEIAAKIAMIIGIGLLVVVGLFIVLMLIV